VSRRKYDSVLCPGNKVSEEQLVTDRSLLKFGDSIRHFNRRNFLTALTSVAAFGAVAGLSGNRSARAQSSSPSPIADLLNFALNLEYLGANLYLLVSIGTGLSSADAGSAAGAITGAPSKLNLDPATMTVAQALAQDKLLHLKFLKDRITITGTPISQPAINFAAQGAITTQAQFLSVARQFSALSGSVYAGLAALVASNLANLSFAATLVGAEGQHAGAINYLCATQGIVSPAMDKQDVPPDATTYFTAAADNALAPTRDSSQALGIVYAVSTPTLTTPPLGVTMGGFFPNGVNGTIKST
jgi:hypothetical protein